MLVPKDRIDLAPYMKHVKRLYAQSVAECGLAAIGSIECAMDGDFQILAAEGCLLTDAEFEEREKPGTLPTDFLRIKR